MTQEVFFAKISELRINKMPKSKKIEIASEVNIISQLNHQLFLKFIGYSPVNFHSKQFPSIFIEFAANNTLKNILDISKKVDRENLDFLGHHHYSAPEIFKGKYSKASDIYSFAMIAYEIMTNLDPYDDLSEFEILQQTTSGFRPKFTANMPKCYCNLISECCSKDPTKRPALEQIVKLLKSDSKFITEKINSKEFFGFCK